MCIYIYIYIYIYARGISYMRVPIVSDEVMLDESEYLDFGNFEVLF